MVWFIKFVANEWANKAMALALLLRRRCFSRGVTDTHPRLYRNVGVSMNFVYVTICLLPTACKIIDSSVSNNLRA